MAKKKATRKKSTPRAKSELGAYFTSLTLENVRCFGPEPQTLDLTDGNGRPAQWTILLGDNGTGKTTILQVLGAAILSGMHFIDPHSAESDFGSLGEYFPHSFQSLLFGRLC